MYQQQLTHPSKSSFHVNQPLAGFCQQNSHPHTPAISRQGITTRGKHSTCQQTQQHKHKHTVDKAQAHRRQGRRQGSHSRPAKPRPATGKVRNTNQLPPKQSHPARCNVRATVDLNKKPRVFQGPPEHNRQHMRQVPEESCTLTVLHTTNPCMHNAAGCACTSPHVPLNLVTPL